MNTPPYKLEEIHENCKALVLENSKKGLAAIFSMPGNEHEAAANCRVLLAEALQ